MKALIEAVRLIAKLLRNHVANVDDYRRSAHALVDEMYEEAQRSVNVKGVLEDAAASILTRANDHARAANDLSDVAFNLRSALL